MTLGAFLRMSYVKAEFAGAVRARPGIHTSVIRPSPSYRMSVFLSLASTVEVGRPQAG